MKKWLRPSLIIPLTLGAAVLAALVAVSHPAQVLAVMEGFHYRYLLPILALMVAYETFRCAQWGFLLRALGVHVPLRAQVFSFLGGEVASFLPVGTYFRNYLLGRSKGTGFSRSSAATTMSLVSEIFICLAGVLILGLGDWSTWLRPLIVVGLAIFLLLVWAVRRSGYAPVAPRWLRDLVVFQRAMNEIRQFRAGAVALWRPRVLVVQSILGALYLTVAGTVLYVVLRSLGIGHVTFWQALGVYFFSLAFFLLSPVSVGMIEVSGVAALVVVGVDEPAAVGAMLLYRLLRTGFPLAIAVVGLAILHREVRAALRERGE
jgi:uncharacterized membrane protein YbhN (UPF0104 family)